MIRLQYPWFTRSSVGGCFGGELKRAGYDGIVVTGASETVVRLCIRDDEVSILPADDLLKSAGICAQRGCSLQNRGAFAFRPVKRRS
ncbi:MAG: aldehyde ferredoxin oxidoreductase N-terminal domain-containing protein [Chloroflexota bacterium]|nr:aldehyde ferredoxin oxidoreductase N-terminal domain-containing protein [Chloroflexota bacterium]